MGLKLLGVYLGAGENSSSGPQPYQPYEAEATNSPISNIHKVVQHRRVGLKRYQTLLIGPCRGFGGVHNSQRLAMPQVPKIACVKVSLINLFSRFSASLLAFLLDPEYSYARTHVTEVLRNTLATPSIGGHYSGHFFRRGAATSARRAELSEEEIQLLGRWKSDSYRLYIEAQPSYILNASRRHQR